MATTASRLLDNQGEFHFYVRIEGIGFFEGGQSKSVYLFSRLPDWAAGATQKFIDGLMIPKGFSQSIDIIGGIESPSNLDIEFEEFYNNVGTVAYQTEPLWGSLFASSRAIYDISTNYPVTELTSTLTHAATVSMAVKSTAAFPTSGQLCIGNETITYTGKTATTFTTLSRGLHPAATGDEARKRHRTQGADTATLDANPIVATVPFTWYNRRVALYLFHRDQDGTWGTEAESLLLYKGRITSRGWTGQHWKLSTRSIVGDLERTVFRLSNTPRSTVGYYVTADTVGAFGSTKVTMIDSGGAILSADSYSFAVSGFFASAFDIGASIINGNFDAAPGDKLPRVSFYLTDGGMEVFYTGPGAGSGVVEPATALGFVFLRDANGNRIQSFTPYALNVVGAIVDHTYNLSVQQDGGYVVRRNVTETLRLNSNTGWYANQGDWPLAAQSFAFGETATEGGYGLFVIPSIIGGNPSQVQMRFLGYTPKAMFYAEDLWVGKTGAAEFRQVFYPYLGDGLGAALLRMMVSTGESAIHGAYDVLVDGIGAGIDDNDIDLTSFTRLDEAFPELGAHRFLAIAKPTPLKEVLDYELKLLGYMIVMVDGKITLRPVPTFGYRSGTQSVLTLDESNQDKETDRPTYHESADGIYNTITLKYGWDEANEEFVASPITIVDIQSQDLFGKSRDLTIEHHSLRKEIGVESYIQHIIARMQAFRFPYPRVERTISRDLWARLDIGDRVRFTDRSMPSPYAATYGVTNVMGFVERLSYNYENRNGRVTLRLFPSNREAPFAPSAEVTAYDAGTFVLTVAATTFGGDGASGNDALLFDVGDQVRISERNPANVATADAWTREVASRTSTTIGLTTALSAPAFDATKEYFVTFARYDLSIAAQLLEASFQADQADGIILTTQDFYKYT